MKYYEQYAAEINELKNNKFYTDFIVPNILKTDDEDDMVCNAISAYQTLLLLENYEEPNRGCTIDWYKVPVDTPILVRDSRNEEWQRKHFALYKGGKVYAWSGRCTSWTIEEYNIVPWNYAKLVK